MQYNKKDRSSVYVIYDESNRHKMCTPAFLTIPRNNLQLFFYGSFSSFHNCLVVSRLRFPSGTWFYHKNKRSEEKSFQLSLCALITIMVEKGYIFFPIDYFLRALKITSLYWIRGQSARRFRVKYRTVHWSSDGHQNKYDPCCSFR